MGTIYLDMDGVVADWDTAAHKVLGTDPKSGEITGAAKNRLWKEIDRLGDSFWLSIPPFPWARDFYNELTRIDEVIFASSPSLHPSSCSGKLGWLQQFTGSRHFRNYMFTNLKHKLAAGDRSRILIDDKEKHVDSFSSQGGLGLLFPRPYNRAKREADDPVSAILQTLAQVYPGRVNLS